MEENASRGIGRTGISLSTSINNVDTDPPMGWVSAWWLNKGRRPGELKDQGLSGYLTEAM